MKVILLKFSGDMVGVVGADERLVAQLTSVQMAALRLLLVL
jgi:hypothetical protein